MHRPSELKKFLDGMGIQAKKSLSQNFLIDGNIIAKIVRQADVAKDDTILEIGAGPGALTEALLATGAQVVAVEKDTNFARALSRFEGLEVFAGDIRDFPLERMPPGSKVVANLPYHLTTPILALLVPRSDLFSTLTVMVQDEVARRMCAKAGTRLYSSLTVFLNFYSSLHYGFFVSNRCFYPEPKVNSAVVTLKLKAPPAVDSEERFFDLVHTAFGQRRKMLRSSLKKNYPAIIDSPFAENRPESLSLEDFLRLYEELR